MTRIAIGLVVALSLLNGGQALAAGLEKGQWIAMIYGGNYEPAADDLDSQGTVGLRFGYAFTGHFGVGGSLGAINIDEEFDDGGSTLEVDADFIFLDLGVFYAFFDPKRRLRPIVTGGIGLASVDADASVQGRSGSVDLEGYDDSTLTVNAGFGLSIRAGDRFYLRLLNKWRYFDEREEDEVDSELSLGFAWTFGGK